MANRMTTFEQLKAASVAAQNNIADVAQATVDAIESLETESEEKFYQRRGRVPNGDANEATNEGIYEYSGAVTNFYVADGEKTYGRLLVFNNKVTGESGVAQVWIWQIALVTYPKQVWIRNRVNTEDWGAWRRFMDIVDYNTLNSSIASHTTSINNLNLSVGQLCDYQVKEYSWIGKATCATWSRLCYVACATGVIGSSFIINVAGTRSNVVYNETFAVSVNHSKYASITKLSTGKYSTISVRCTVDSQGDAYFEIYDAANNCTNTTTQNFIYCRLIALRCGEVTTYTAITDGTTLADGFAVGASMEVDKHDLQSTNGVASADKVNGYTITAGTSDMTAGSSALASGTIYILYK